jgi:hypothetical protein
LEVSVEVALAEVVPEEVGKKIMIYEL